MIEHQDISGSVVNNVNDRYRYRPPAPGTIRTHLDKSTGEKVYYVYDRNGNPVVVQTLKHNPMLKDENFWKLSRDEQFSVLHDEMWKLQKRIEEIQVAELKRKNRLPEEVNLKPEKKHFRLGRGKGARHLLEGEIKIARQHTDSERQAAKYLGVCYDTFKKYCRLYGMDIKGGRKRGKLSGILDENSSPKILHM